jgi:hypothetical protein
MAGRFLLVFAEDSEEKTNRASIRNRVNNESVLFFSENSLFSRER